MLVLAYLEIPAEFPQARFIFVILGVNHTQLFLHINVVCNVNRPFMIDKKIYRYSNVELFDIIKNGTNKPKIESAQSELNSRNLSIEQKAIIESDYIKYKEYQNDRKDQPLTDKEWLSFFILPFFTTKPRWREDHFTESEMERLRKYGFEKKYQQAEKIRAFGYLFWFLVIMCSTLIFIKLNK